MKQLKKTSNEEPKNHSSARVGLEDFITLFSENEIHIEANSADFSEINSAYSETYSFIHFSPIFHPPQA